MSPLIDVLAARVHDSYVRDKLAAGVTALPSRRGTGDLMRPFADLDERDKDDDRRTVRTILGGLADLPWMQVCDLLLSFRDDAGLLTEVRDACERVDPVPDGLADDCLDALAGEDGQR